MALLKGRPNCVSKAREMKKTKNKICSVKLGWGEVSRN